jgi:hypothetical protein
MGRFEASGVCTPLHNPCRRRYNIFAIPALTPRIISLFTIQSTEYVVLRRVIGCGTWEATTPAIIYEGICDTTFVSTARRSLTRLAYSTFRILWDTLRR